MEGKSLSTWLAVSCVFAVAGLLRGFTGFGFALVAVPFGALWVAPDALIPTVLLLQLYIGLFEVRSAIQLCDRPSVLSLLAGGAIGTPLGVYALVVLPLPIVYAIIGTIVLISTVLLIVSPSANRLPLSTGAVAGVLAGVFNGMAAMPGPPAIFYFVKSGFSPTQTRSSLVLFFFVAAICALCATFYAGLLHKDEIIFSFVTFPIIALSTWAGARLFQSHGGDWYRLVGIAGLIGAAAAAFMKAFNS